MPAISGKRVDASFICRVMELRWTDPKEYLAWPSPVLAFGGKRDEKLAKRVTFLCLVRKTWFSDFLPWSQILVELTTTHYVYGRV